MLEFNWSTSAEIEMRFFVLFLTLLFYFSTALPAIRCHTQNVLSSYPRVDCANKKVIAAFCNGCVKRGKTKRFILDATQLVKDPNYSKIYNTVCTKNTFFDTK